MLSGATRRVFAMIGTSARKQYHNNSNSNEASEGVVQFFCNAFAGSVFMDSFLELQQHDSNIEKYGFDTAKEKYKFNLLFLSGAALWIGLTPAANGMIFGRSVIIGSALSAASFLCKKIVQVDDKLHEIRIQGRTFQQKEESNATKADEYLRCVTRELEKFNKKTRA